MGASEDLKETELASKASCSTEESASTCVVQKEIQETADANSQEKKDVVISSKTPSSPPRRPLTRSQTGTVSKRRKRDDSEDLGGPKKRAPASRKKQKAASVSEAQSANARVQESSSPKAPTTREPSLSSVSSGVVTSNTTQLKFYHASPTSEDQVACRLPRSRATLPTPIPNLTKKSRGRRVPTHATGNSDPDQKDQRLYVCQVEGCGKCFHRGEHLKRHIRSIHTHEKPFKCTFPLCQKYFNRHDNLLQHLKVHRDVIPKDDGDAPAPKPASNRSRSRSASPLQHRERSYSPPYEPESPVTTSMPRTIYNAFPVTSYNPYPAPISYSTTSGTNSLITNMAVSSLRTELPHSPIDPRRNTLQSTPY